MFEHGLVSIDVVKIKLISYGFGSCTWFVLEGFQFGSVDERNDTHLVF